MIENINEFFTRPKYYVQWSLGSEDLRYPMLTSITGTIAFLLVALLFLLLGEWFLALITAFFVALTVGIAANCSVRCWRLSNPEEDEQ